MRIPSGVCVLAAHDHAEWGMGLDDVDGGRKRPDARRGAVRCAVFGRGFLVVDDGVCMSVVQWRVGGARAVGGEFEIREAAPCCVYRVVPLRIH
jgi:hypothetical protein